MTRLLYTIFFKTHPTLGDARGEPRNRFVKPRSDFRNPVGRLTALAVQGKVGASTQNQALAALMYGGGLLLMESLQLRIQDIDFTHNKIIVRNGKGAKERITMLPNSLKLPIEEHLKKIKKIPDGGF